MKLTSLLGVFAAGGIVAAGKITSYTLSSTPNESEKILDSKPEIPEAPKPPQLAQKLSSLDLSKPEEEFIAPPQEPTPTPKKIVSLNDKQKLIEKIRDYTMKIVCVTSNTSGAGTGWFLDYELPADGRYPTKWFVATNVHVVAACPFLWDPYDQRPEIVKKSDDSQSIFLYRWESGGNDEEKLRNENIDFEEPDFWSSKEAEKHKPYTDTLPPSRDALTATDEVWSKKKEIPSMHIKILDPKLFYASLNHSRDSEGNSIYSFLDFAVMEINFPDEKSAKRMTQQVYYKPDDEKIKVIGDVKENSELYTAGYPNNSFNPYRSVGNYSPTRDTASRKKNCVLLANSTLNIQMWRRFPYKSNICYQVLDNFYSRRGSSGSMIIDESGTLLGLHSRGDKENKLSYTQPIRAERKTCYPYSRHCKEQPAYDLITGSPNQKSSYKQQLLKYLPTTNTYLKNKYNWEITSTDK